MAFLLILQPHIAFGLYDPTGPVALLTPSNFDSKLKKGVWVVEFFAPWYGW